MKKLILIGLFVTSFCFVNAQIEQNDSIKSKTEKKEFIDPIYGTPIPNPKKNLQFFSQFQIKHLQQNKKNH